MEKISTVKTKVLNYMWTFWRDRFRSANFSSVHVRSAELSSKSHKYIWMSKNKVDRWPEKVCSNGTRKGEKIQSDWHNGIISEDMDASKQMWQMLQKTLSWYTIEELFADTKVELCLKAQFQVSKENRKCSKTSNTRNKAAKTLNKELTVHKRIPSHLT